MRKAIVVLGTAILVVLSSPNFAQQKSAVKGLRGGATRTPRTRGLNCDDPGVYCTDLATHKNYEGKYSGHDEPALAFYSDTPGSGNNVVVHLTLPTDPPTLPKQDGTGGTFNFQLQPAFWFSMSLCDTQSAPAPDFNPFCTPDSDFNIFESTDVNASDFLTIHPGSAFMELQFYPPGWIGTTVVDPTHWFAALTIDSFNFSWASFTDNNADCINKIGSDETVNYALITRNNVTVAPPDPLSIAMDPTFAAFTPTSNTLAMNPGDYLTIFMHDSPSGFRVIIFDQTTHQFGWMTASVANGFQQVVFAPDPDPNNPSVTCSEQPYAFHPMYSTSSEKTRVVWAAHAFNVGFGGELGHFEYCNAVDANGNCTSAGVSEPDGVVDGDDASLFGFLCGSTVPPPANPFVPLIGCIGADIDFDGVAFGRNWPGSLADPVMDHLLHATPLRFTGPKFSGPSGQGNYSRVAFESNVPGNEIASCDPFTGDGCVNPPPGASFYPFYSTGVLNGQCVWQFGDANFPGTTNVFGGTAAAEFGPLITTNLPFGIEALPLFEDYRQVIPNPCLGR